MGEEGFVAVSLSLVVPFHFLCALCVCAYKLEGLAQGRLSQMTSAWFFFGFFFCFLFSFGASQRFTDFNINVYWGFFQDRITLVIDFGAMEKHKKARKYV